MAAEKLVKPLMPRPQRKRIVLIAVASLIRVTRAVTSPSTNRFRQMIVSAN
jgi:hypothetical protein